MTKYKRNRRFIQTVSRYSTIIIQHKPLMFTVLFAVVIGLVFGVIALQLTKQAGPVTQMEKPQETEEIHVESGMQTMDVISFYVVQGGVFTDKDNAAKAIEVFQAKDVPAMQWEADGEIYLFAGIAATENKAKEYAEEMKADKLEVYVKPWEVGAVQISLTKYEHKWLSQFTKVWQESLAGEGQEWSVLQQIDEQPGESPLKLIDQLRESINGSTEMSQMELLELIYMYEKAFE